MTVLEFLNTNMKVFAELCAIFLIFAFLTFIFYIARKE